MTQMNNEFVVSRYIGASRNTVWDAWSIPENLEQWWCPKPFTAKLLDFDLYPGGAFNLLMQSPDGMESKQTGAFLDVVLQERITFTTALTKEWRPSPTPMPITGIISMVDEGEGTRYNTRVLYKNDEERQQLGDFKFEEGWTQAIEQLVEFVTRT